MVLIFLVTKVFQKGTIFTLTRDSMSHNGWRQGFIIFQQFCLITNFMNSIRFGTFKLQVFYFHHSRSALVSIYFHSCTILILLRSTLGERFVIFGDPVVDGIPVHARREDSRFLVTWTGDVQNLRHLE